MKDDPAFNIHFVSMVEKYTCIYDFTCADYNNRNKQDAAWEAIGKDVDEPVSDCKERWKNVRACFTRHLKHMPPSGSAAKLKKPYYLSEYLQFLLPFTKTRKPTGNSRAAVRSPERDFKCEEVVSETELEEEPEGTEHFPAPAAPSQKRSKRGSPMEYFHMKHDPFQEDPDFCFLKSLLPDMNAMNADQKRRYKIGILQLSGEIMNETPQPLS